MSGGLAVSPNVRSSDASQLVIPGRTVMAGKGGQVVKVNPAGTGYELGAAGGGGGFAIGMTRLQFTGAGVSQANPASSSTIQAVAPAAIDTEWGAPAGAAPTITLGAAGSVGWNFAAAGWYIVRVRMNAYFTDLVNAPDRVEFRLDYTNVIFNMYQSAHVGMPVSGSTTSKAFVTDYTSRPLWMTAGENMSCRWTWGKSTVATVESNGIIAEITRVGN